uniref:PDZ domain-containing protein n=1 Tax=Pelusios castaneus TaxID=367368 RepID=A0A8C8RYW6_9SAUR
MQGAEQLQCDEHTECRRGGGNHNGAPCSDYIIKEKTVLLQKKDNEGFGFVLRGAKAQTPIEEFTPTPAFPALQYLESVDEGGVAWRAGLRMGDFLIEVNGQNVVKVGHRQVVNMIRQGGNNLMVKVVMVTRNPEMEEAMRKKGTVTPPSPPHEGGQDSWVPPPGLGGEWGLVDLPGAVGTRNNRAWAPAPSNSPSLCPIFNTMPSRCLPQSRPGRRGVVSVLWAGHGVRGQGALVAFPTVRPASPHQPWCLTPVPQAHLLLPNSVPPP